MPTAITPCLRFALCVVLACASSGSTWSGICDGQLQTSIDGRAVSALIEDLEGHDFPAAEAAREALRNDAAIALPAIVRIQCSKEYPFHRSASPSLRAVFSGAENATRALLPGLGCGNWKVRESTALVLGWIGGGAEPAIPALVSALGDSFWGVRMQAAFTLRNIGVMNPSVIKGLRNRLDDDAAIVANAAAMALARYPEQTIDAVEAALGASQARTRRFAARSVRKMAEPPKCSFPHLLAMLKDDTTENRIEVIEALRAWDPAVMQEAVPVLLPLLEVADLSCPAARLLALKGGERSSQALPALVKALQDLDEDSTACANQAYRDISAIGPAAIPAMIGLLDHVDLRTRRFALLALGRIEPQNPESMEAIAAMLADDELGADARELLVSIGQPAVGLLVGALDHKLLPVRSEAAIALGRIGAGAVDAVPALVRGLRDEDGDARKPIIVALGSIGGPDGSAAIPLLRAALEEPALQVEAATALGHIAGAEAEDVASILADALRVQVTGSCRHPTADAALRAIGPNALPSILDLLADDTFRSKGVALSLLDALGTEAVGQARPVFEAWVNDPRGYHGLAGAERLLQLEGQASPAMIDLFNEALGHWNPWSRLRGAEGLVRTDLVGTTHVRAVLTGLLDHRHDAIRIRAERALSQLD